MKFSKKRHFSASNSHPIQLVKKPHRNDVFKIDPSGGSIRLVAL
jgi:hypothetical protein